MRFITGERIQQIAEQTNGVCYSHTHLLDEFFQEAYPRIKEPFVLVSHNSDYCVDEKYRKYLDEGKIKKWFAQNVVMKHDKLIPLPIGLANSKWPHGNLEIFDEAMTIVPKPTRLLYMNFKIGTNQSERKPVWELFKTKRYVTVGDLQDYKPYLEELVDHEYCLAPVGNGLDSHRIWECLYLGVIPIIKQQELNDVYKGLPILAMNKWEDITEALLLMKSKEIKKIYAHYDWYLTSLNYWHMEIVDATGNP